jgi:hypothetical protein
MHPGARALLAAGIQKTGVVAFVPVGAPMDAHAHTTRHSRSLKSSRENTA